MSTAVLISGQLRTFARCWPTQSWHVLRHFDDPHFFITVQRPETDDAFECLQPLLDAYGPDRVHVDFRTDPDLSAHLTPELARAYHLAPYANAAPAHQLLLQHWYQNECWKNFLRLEEEDQFDTIVRLRADLWFHSFDETGIINPPQYPAGVCFSPWWGRFGGINDRFAIMDRVGAIYYFTIYDRIGELISRGCPFHPETLLKAALDAEGVESHPTLKTEFSTLRTNGDVRPPEIAPWDIAHASLRAA